LKWRLNNEKIKIEWCENFIKATFAKFPEGVGIYDCLFWDLAAKSGLYEKNTYGSPMSAALEKLVKIDTVTVNDDGDAITVFRLK